MNAARLTTLFSGKTLWRAAWSVCERSAGFALNFIALLVLVRLVPKESYGVWAFFLALTGLFELYKATAVNATLLFQVPRTPDRSAECFEWARRANMRSLAVVSLVCVMCAVASCAFRQYITAWFFVVYPLWSWALIGQTLSFTFLQTRMEFHRAALLRLALSACSLAAIASLALVSYQWRIRALPVFTVAGIFAGTLLARRLTHDVPLRKKRVADDVWNQADVDHEHAKSPLVYDSKSGISPQLSASLSAYARRAWGTSACSSLYRSSDLLMIGFFRTPEIVALYSIAMKLADLMELPLQAATPLVMGRVSEHSANARSRWVSALYWRASLVLSAICLPACLVFWLAPQLILKVFAGAQYVAAWPTLMVFGIVALIRPIDRLAGVFLDAVGRPADNLRKTVLLTIVNIAANGLALWIFAGQSALPWIAAVSVLALLVSGSFGVIRLIQLGWLFPRCAVTAAIVCLACATFAGCASLSKKTDDSYQLLESQKLTRRWPQGNPRPEEFTSQTIGMEKIPKNWIEWVLDADQRDLVLIALINHPTSGEAQALTDKNEASLKIEKKSWMAPFGFELNGAKIIQGPGSEIPWIVEELRTAKFNLQREMSYFDRVRYFERERDIARQHEDVVRGELAWNVRRRLEQLRGAVRLLCVRSESMEATTLQEFYADRDFRVGLIPVHEWARVTEIADRAREAYITSLSDVRVFKSDVEEALGVSLEDAFYLRYGKKPDKIDFSTIGGDTQIPEAIELSPAAASKVKYRRDTGVMPSALKKKVN